MISFNDTEIALKHKSDADLQRAYFLFKTLAKRKLVDTGSLLTKVALNLHLPLRWAIKPTIYRHFCGGETIRECIPVIENLANFNVKAVLDYSVEGSETDEGIQAALDETLEVIKFAARNENIPFSVFKPTAFCRNEVLEKVGENKHLTTSEQTEADNFRERVNLLCKTAYDNDIPIMIDAEDSFYQDFIDDVVTDMMRQYNRKKAIVYNTYQMYRWDRLEKLKNDYFRSVEEKYFMGAKFVRGAYMERERRRAEEKGYKSPIHKTKEETDRDYNLALKFTVEHIDKISVFNGTHNEDSSRYLAELMEEHHLPKNDSRIYFSQLYGMSDHISFNLAHLGYNVAKYLPYGPVKHVLPYLIRRAQENTSVEGQTGRELQIISEEVKRRKAQKRRS